MMSEKPLVNNEWITMHAHAVPLRARTDNVSLIGTIASTLDEMRIIYEAELSRLRAQLAEVIALNKRNADDAVRAINAEKCGMQLAVASVTEWGKREQYIKKLEAQLAEAQQWEDVPDGKYVNDNFRVDRINGHTLVAVQAYRNERRYWTGSTLPDNWRIQCRKESEANDG